MNDNAKVLVRLVIMIAFGLFNMAKMTKDDIENRHATQINFDEKIVYFIVGVAIGGAVANLLI